MGESFDVRKWIRFAFEDYDSALTLANKQRPNIQIACYHCQQSAEKILKAYILAKGSTFKNTHDLGFLNVQCQQHDLDFRKFDKICTTLKAYTVAGRYPQSIDLTEHHMARALKDAEELLVFTKAKLKELGFEYDPDDGIQVIADADAKK